MLCMEMCWRIPLGFKLEDRGIACEKSVELGFQGSLEKRMENKFPAGCGPVQDLKNKRFGNRIREGEKKGRRLFSMRLEESFKEKAHRGNSTRYEANAKEGFLREGGVKPIF